MTVKELKEILNNENLVKARVDDSLVFVNVKYDFVNAKMATLQVPYEVVRIFNPENNTELVLISNISSDMLHDVVNTIQDDFPGSGPIGVVTTKDLIKDLNAEEVPEELEVNFVTGYIQINEGETITYPAEVYPISSVEYVDNLGVVITCDCKDN